MSKRIVDEMSPYVGIVHNIFYLLLILVEDPVLIIQQLIVEYSSTPQLPWSDENLDKQPQLFP